MGRRWQNKSLGGEGMRKTKHWLMVMGSAVLLAVLGGVVGGAFVAAQEPAQEAGAEPAFVTDHSQCTLFGADRDQFYEDSVNRQARRS